jgi:ABC-type sugar transport system ATPase subunit
MISSELPEALAMSDRILVMCGGRISGEVPREEATEARILWLALGQPADPAAAGAAGRGFPVT